MSIFYSPNSFRIKVYIWRIGVDNTYDLKYHSQVYHTISKSYW